MYQSSLFFLGITILLIVPLVIMINTTVRKDIRYLEKLDHRVAKCEDKLKKSNMKYDEFEKELNVVRKFEKEDYRVKNQLASYTASFQNRINKNLSCWQWMNHDINKIIKSHTKVNKNKKLIEKINAYEDSLEQLHHKLYK